MQHRIVKGAINILKTHGLCNPRDQSLNPVLVPPPLKLADILQTNKTTRDFPNL